MTDKTKFAPRTVDRWLFVQGTDYDDAWQQVLEAEVNEFCGYTDQYQATELTEDMCEDENVYQFKITVHYAPEQPLPPPLADDALTFDEVEAAGLDGSLRFIGGST